MGALVGCSFVSKTPLKLITVHLHGCSYRLQLREQASGEVRKLATHWSCWFYNPSHVCRLIEEVCANCGICRLLPRWKFHRLIFGLSGLLGFEGTRTLVVRLHQMNLWRRL